MVDRARGREMGLSESDFFEQVVNLSKQDFSRPERLSKVVCLGIGTALGAGLAGAVSRNPSGAQALGQLKAYTSLAALLVGFVVGMGSCTAVRFKLADYLEAVRHLPLARAVSTLTPQRKDELRAEANKLLALESQINGVMQEERVGADLI